MSKKPTYQELEQRIKELEQEALEHKQAMEVIKESEDQFRLVFDKSNDVMIIHKVAKIQDVNQRACEVTGYSREQLLAMSILDLFPKEYQSEIESRLKRNVQAGATLFETKWKRADGKLIDVEVSSRVFNTKEGYRVGITRDITDRKQAEEALRESEAFNSSLLEYSPNPILVTHQDTSIKYINPMFEELTGYTSKEIIGEKAPFPWWIDDPKSGNLSQLTENILKGIQGIEMLFRKKNGELFWVEVSNKPITHNGEFKFVVSNWVDITDRKRAEKTLKESEDRYKSMFHDNPTIIYIRDPDTHRFIDVNPAAISFYGYSLEEMIGMEITKLTRGGLEGIQQRAKRSLIEGKNHFFATHYLSNGEKRDVEIYNGPITIGGKKVIYGIVHDVTERRRSEEALRESEERYRKIFEHSGFGINLVDLETGKYVEFNQMAYESLGYTYEEYKNLTPQDFNIDETEDSFRVRRRKVIEEGSAFVESRQRTKNGEIIHKLISIVPVTIKEKQYLQTINIDITAFKKAEEEKTKLEAQLQQAQKLESIGTLAGGIAHDFNNILSPIMIHSEMAMMDFTPDNPIQHNLIQIYKAGERARDMVKQILAFGRQKQQERIVVKMGSILKEVLKLIRSTIPTTIDIRHNIEAETDTVFADPTQIHQVILNLCINASHAMREKGGTLEIELDELDLNSDAIVKFDGFIPGFYLRLTVRDTGHGIAPEVKDRIFDPYFTTKEVGEGTGMGLAVAHGIVKGHGGDIKVESEPGKGTTFSVLLPKYEGKNTEKPERIPMLRGGTERVLLVDDESAAVDAIQTMLENLGYKVTARTSSIEALEAFRDNPEGFDLVITDMTMPNMTGKDLAKELMSMRHDIPIILCTGYSEQIDEYKAKEMGINAFVMKPIVMRYMANTIREVLDKT